ncbi:LytR/AlgR family response regulator transcription factor [Sunxiuqinia sp. A32]|uniref:LytR/AlgR family response regulator transcription factor n=1 Tax=Sunxiuqinia sp. A32 TaxID=3461496 RepID=UPI00404629AF
MKIIIVEDEQHNYRLLKGMINKLRPDWEICGSFESVKSTVDWLQNNPAPELIFMDIQLTDGISFSIFEQVEVKSMVIFTTAYDEYALRAFKVNSIDYLLKPIKEEKLNIAIEKFERISNYPARNSESNINYKEILNAIVQGEKKYRKRFLISGVSSFFKIDVEDIAYFITENRITQAVTFEAKKHIVDFTIEKLEEELDPDRFFKANRSTILNSESIRKFENYFGGKLVVKLVHPLDEPVTISRLKATEFKEWLGK